MNSTLDPVASEDRRLVELHLAGDAGAFRHIVERYQAMVCALALSATGDLARSEDLAQEVFIVAWRQLPELREPEKLRAWLGGITRNLARDSTRRQRRVPTAGAEPLSPETLAEGGDPRDHAVGSDEAALMWRALEGIPEIYREPMVLFYREQRSMPAVAATLEISEELVRQRLARGRAMLSERMAVIVQETLERTGPTAAFASMVVLGLPWTLGSATVALAEAGTAGTQGASVTKTLAAVGAVGSAAAKGGLAVKALAVLAFLPAVLSGTEEFFRFREKHCQLGDEPTRRRVAWSYVLMNAGLGLLTVGCALVPGWLVERKSPPLHFALLAAAMVAVLWLYESSRRRLKRLVRVDLPGLFDKLPEQVAPAFEFRSRTSWLDLPLIHVRIGGKHAWKLPVVKAWIAICDGRAMGGLFACGLGAVAPVSLGLGSAGVISIGLFSLGGWVLGGLGAGWVSDGVITVGIHAARGVFAFAGDYALNSVRNVTHPLDAPTQAFFQTYGFYRFTRVFKDALMLAVWLGWIVPVMLMSGHLWKTRRRR